MCGVALGVRVEAVGCVWVLCLAVVSCIVGDEEFSPGGNVEGAAAAVPWEDVVISKLMLPEPPPAIPVRAGRRMLSRKFCCAGRSLALVPAPG